MLASYGKLLGTVPFSAGRPGITSLMIRAVDSTEPPLEEYDLRAAPATAEGCIALALPHEHFDCAYEARAHWDLWTQENGAWRRGAQPLELLCCGEEYDNGAFQEIGHLQVDLGFAENFVASEANGGNPQRGENARGLSAWLQQIKGAIPITRQALWSEEDDAFEAQLDAVLAHS